MTKLKKRICAIGVATAFMAGSQAGAADMDGIFVDDANFIQKPAELGSGWYIRGDLGINFNGNHDVSIYGNPAFSTYVDNNYTDKIHFAVGAGYRFNNFLRMDAGIGRLAGTNYSTSELMYEDEFSANLGDPLAVQPGEANPCNGWGTFVDVNGDGDEYTYIGDDFITNCIDQDNVEYDVVYAMANVYADLGTFYGFTPFVGAGVGIGRLAWREEIDSVVCVPRSAAVREEGCQAFGVAEQPGPNEPYTQPGTVSEGVDYRLGYSVTAGLGYNVTDNVTIEAAYRYMNFGAKILSTGGTTGAGLSSNGYGTHQVNFGLRYNIW